MNGLSDTVLHVFNNGGNSKGLADYEIIIQSVNPSSARVQECHQFLLHELCERAILNIND